MVMSFHVEYHAPVSSAKVPIIVSLGPTSASACLWYLVVAGNDCHFLAPFSICNWMSDELGLNSVIYI